MHAVVNRNNDSAVQLRADCNGSQFFADQILKKTGQDMKNIYVRDPQKNLPPKENPTEPHNISLIVQ